MQRRRITNAGELHRLLQEGGVDLSRQAVYRIVKTAPERLSLQTVEALCRVLDCTPADLLDITPAPAAPHTIPLPPDFMLRKMT